MDGASKFVKGDAIAGIIISLINIIGGFIVGVLQQGLTMQEALSKYTLLTVGDGLISQIPALLIATATGIIITRTSSDENMGTDMSHQLFSNPKVLGICSVVLLLFAFVPGLPVFPFLMMGSIIGAMSYSMNSFNKTKMIQQMEKTEASQEKEVITPESIFPLLRIDPLELEIGYHLIPFVEPEQGGDMLERLGSIRRQLALDLGMVVPLVRVRDNAQLKPDGYRILISGNIVAEGELRIGEYLAIDSGIGQEKLDGIQTQEPAFGISATWISKQDVDRAEQLGYTIVDPVSVLATHLTEVIRSHAHDLLNRQHTKQLIDNVKAENPVLIEELIPDLLTVGEIQKVLQNLLRERVSIRDLVTILEALADGARITKDTQALTEHVRARLGRTICWPYVGQDGVMRVIVLDAEIEENFINMSNEGLAITPEYAQKILASIAEQSEMLASIGQEPVILCSPRVRPEFKNFIEPTFRRIPVISYRELDPSIRIESVGVVKVL
jgi:flagellar biosynthesis protein FlhA